jgi:5S rRNA maturation endonuclease (ribonuclease M5)
VLLHCHAGCSQQDVIAALEARGLWETAGDAVGWRRIVATYDYTDEDGELLYQIVRFEPKDFRQRRPGPGGQWVWKKGQRQVLYRLPEVLDSPIVFLVEGEKDVETLRSHGFVATTNAGGANAPWLPTFTESLRGREVILIPDNDPPGKARVLTIARALLGNAAKIIVVELEGANDITDWFAAGHSETELIAQVEGEEVSK